MDLRTVFPPMQEGKTLHTGSFSAFGLSLQGASHGVKDPPVPCQDYSDFRYLEREDLFIAAIADGVGSCELSHWGAYTAVCTVLNSVEGAFKAMRLTGKLVLDSSMNAELKQIMLQAFHDAQSAVDKMADEGMVLPALCMSTLTLAIYDGENLFFAHVGDDGIVAQMEDGTVEMVTVRLKGEEASSVYPLQSGERKWKFGRAAKKVAGFVMATDGVLDAFVTNRPDYFNVNYNKGVFYPFMKDAMEMLAEDGPGAAEKAMDQYKAFMLSEDYRKAVTDDLTLIAVTSNRLIKTAQKPKFNTKIWEVISAESSNARRMALRRKAVPLEGLKAMQGTQQDHASVSDNDYQQLVEENAGLKQWNEKLQAESEAAKQRHIDGQRKMQQIFALAIAGAILVGVLAGRAFFPKVSKAEYTELNESYEQLLERYAALEQEENTAEQENGQLREALEQAEEKLQEAGVANEELQEQLDVLKEAYGLTDEDIAILFENKAKLQEIESIALQAQSKAESAMEFAREAEAASVEALTATDAAVAAAAAEKAQIAAANAEAAYLEANQAAANAFVAGNGLEEATEFVNAAQEAATAAQKAVEEAKEAFALAEMKVKELSATE